MQTFQYKARDKQGKSVEGKMGAESESAVVKKLEQMGFLPISIENDHEEPKFRFGRDVFRSVNYSDLNMFTRQLYTLEKAGLPILSGLNSIKQQVSNLKLKTIIDHVARDVEAGSTLSAALAKHPGCFNDLYVSMVESGEASGHLDEVLERLAILGEHDEKIRLQINAAMRYPIIVICTMALGFVALITMVVPKFSKLYAKFETGLPIPTQILIGLNQIITQFWWLIILAICFGILYFRNMVKTESGRLRWDSLKLKIPVFGPLFLKLSMSRFSRMTGTLISSGISIIQVLELVSKSVGNAAIAKTIDNIRESVSEGKGMFAPMEESQMFPPIVTQMVSVGEKSGKLDELLIHVSEYYDQQVDHTIKNLVSLIEPFLIIVLGLVVLLLALGIFMPMWDLIKLFKTA